MTEPVIDTKKLAGTATNVAQRFFTNTANDFMNSVDNTAGYARDLGVRSDLIDSFMATIKNFFQSIMSSFGLSLPSETPVPETPAAPTTPPTAAEIAATKAAEAAAAGNTAANCTNVADSGAPCTTPQTTPAAGTNVAK